MKHAILQIMWKGDAGRLIQTTNEYQHNHAFKWNLGTAMFFSFQMQVIMSVLQERSLRWQQFLAVNIFNKIHLNLEFWCNFFSLVSFYNGSSVYEKLEARSDSMDPIFCRCGLQELGWLFNLSLSLKIVACVFQYLAIARSTDGENCLNFILRLNRICKGKRNPSLIFYRLF